MIVRQNAFLLCQHTNTSFPQTHEKEHVEPVEWLCPCNVSNTTAWKGNCQEVPLGQTETHVGIFASSCYHYCTFKALEETLIPYSGILSLLKILDNEQPIRLRHYSTTHWSSHIWSSSTWIYRRLSQLKTKGSYNFKQGLCGIKQAGKRQS